MARLLLEQDAQDTAILPVQREALLEPIPKSVSSVVDLDHFEEPPGELLEAHHALLGQRDEQLGLVVEVLVERAAPRAGGVEHVLDARARESLEYAKVVGGGGEDALNGLRSRLANAADRLAVRRPAADGRGDACSRGERAQWTR